MNIAFLQDTVNQSIGLMYLSSLVKKDGHTCRLFVEPLETDFLSEIFKFKPDIVGIGVITGAHHWALKVSEEIKKRCKDILIILGGPHPTYFPQIIEHKYIDIVARGEAEISFPELVRRIEYGKDYRDIQGLWIKKNGVIYKNDVSPLVEDLSSLPHPDHYLYLEYEFYRHQTEIPFNTMRGCPYRCSYCYNHVKAALYRGKGKYVRIRDVDDVISEMEFARSIYPNMKSVILYDDIIGIDKLWLKEFCQVYAERINLPWFTSIRADLVDEFVIDNLKGTNCFCLSLGVETGDEELRTMVLGKKIPNSTYIRAVKLLRTAHIKIRTSNMFFLPGEDFFKALKTVDLNRKMKVDFAWVYTLQPYPGTEIYDYAIKYGYLSSSFQFDDIDPLGLINPIIEVKDKNKILVLHRLFHYCVHSNFIRFIIKILVLIPHNPIFDVAYYYSLILSYARYHQVSILRAFKVALSNYRMAKKVMRRRKIKMR